MTDNTEPNLDKSIDEILEGLARGIVSAHNNNYGENIWNAEDHAKVQAKQAIEAIIANQVREARIEEAKLFNRYFDDNQAFKGFAEERLKELGE